ncbi:tetratricopeptide repeat protein [Trichloromonas sp.]|uniref:tetratricopeptide repeat protein n=1 Tax=Trichloromonas sp. TaxID=3069249 RepID=UPI002A3B2EC3|nr:tetratricopeptide repeat protein [Trichloromonas sp.]
MTLLVGLLLIILFLAFFIYFSGLNPQSVTIFLYGDHSFSTSAAILVIGCIAVGLFGGVLANAYNLFSYQVRNIRNTRREKRNKEVVANYREGMTRLLSGDLKKADDRLQRALERDPSRLETHLAMASVKLQEGEAEKALAVLLKAREKEPKSLEVLFKLAATYEECGRNSEAGKIYEDILAIDNGNRKAMRSLRDLLIKQNLWKEALELQKRILKASQGTRRQSEEQEKLLYLRYEVARQGLEDSKGQSKNDLKELRDIIKAVPSFTPARVSLGDALRTQGKTEEASQAWLDGYKALGKSVFLTRIEDLYLSTDNPSPLLAIYRSVANERSDDLTFRLFFGKLLLRLEMVDEAFEQLHAIENAGVDTPQLRLLLGEAYRRRNRMDEAIAEYQKALGLDPQLRLGFICEKCQNRSPVWLSRCPKCGTWGSYVLEGRQEMDKLARIPQAPEARAIHHGEGGV